MPDGAIYPLRGCERTACAWARGIYIKPSFAAGEHIAIEQREIISLFCNAKLYRAPKVHIAFARRRNFSPRKAIKMNKSIKELAVELTIEITAICDNIKGRSVFVNQLLRACSSIGANSYEAKYAQSTADFVHKLEIALKECYETDYWLEILFKIRSIDEQVYKSLSSKCGAIRRKLIASITTAKGEQK